jgi:hypothetical protein
MKPTTQSARGMTVLEIVIAMLVMTIGLAGILALFPVGARLNEMAADDVYSAMTAQKALAAVCCEQGLRARVQAWTATNTGGDALGWNGTTAEGVEGFGGIILSVEKTDGDISTRLRGLMQLDGSDVVGGVPRAGLLAWYNGTTEGNTLRDQSGNANDGTLHGNCQQVSGGKIEQGIDFDGTDDYISLPAAVSNCTDFTFAAWVYWRGGAAEMRLFEFGSSTLKYLYLTPYVSAKIRFAITTSGSGGEQKVDVPMMPVRTWTHICVTVEGSVCRIFRDGTDRGGASNITLNPNDTEPSTSYIGRSYQSKPYFNGIMDEIVVFNRALVAAEIRELHTAGVNGEYPSGEGPSETVFDVKGQADQDNCALLLMTSGNAQNKLYRLDAGTEASPPTFESVGNNCTDFVRHGVSAGDEYRLIGARDVSKRWVTVPEGFYGDGVGPPGTYELGEGVTPGYGYLAIISRVRNSADTFRIDILVYKGYDESMPPEGNRPAVACYTTILSGEGLQ